MTGYWVGMSFLENLISCYRMLAITEIRSQPSLWL